MGPKGGVSVATPHGRFPKPLERGLPLFDDCLGTALQDKKYFGILGILQDGQQENLLLQPNRMQFHPKIHLQKAL
jgi:hypothetical protein